MMPQIEIPPARVMPQTEIPPEQAMLQTETLPERMMLQTKSPLERVTLQIEIHQEPMQEPRTVNSPKALEHPMIQKSPPLQVLVRRASIQTAPRTIQKVLHQEEPKLLVLTQRGRRRRHPPKERVQGVQRLTVPGLERQTCELCLLPRSPSL